MMTLTQQRPDHWKYQPEGLGGKRVIVTGGTTGIGRTTALLLASMGAKVVIFGRNEQHLKDAMDVMQHYADRVHGVIADVVAEDDVERVFAEADQFLKGLDILINNAGVSAGSVTEAEPADYRYVVETNLIGCMSCAKRALPRLKQAGGGRIINVGSISAKSKSAGSDVYVATKSALRGFSESFGKLVEDDNVQVTLIEPGSVGSDLGSKPPQKEREQHEAGETLYSEAIAEAVAYCLTTPEKCNIPFMQVMPLHE